MYSTTLATSVTVYLYIYLQILHKTSQLSIVVHECREQLITESSPNW